jgi:biopolymer transport protein ExbB
VSFDLLSMWASMGVLARAVVLVLSAMSVLVAALALERYVSFARHRRRARCFLGELRLALGQSDAEPLAQVRALAREARLAPLVNVADAAAAAFLRLQGLDALDLVVGVKSAVERTIARETSLLRRGLGGVATIASVAPFVGLFGTVVGIINAFQSMAATGSGGLASVSAGISEALVTTAFGLLVAIPAVALYNHLSGMVDTFVVDMDEVASELIEAVLVHKKSAK